MRISKQQKHDIQLIAAWLYQNVSEYFKDTRQAEAWAALIVTQSTYDRAEPIVNNRLSGISFDVPSPKTLEALWDR